MNKKDKAYARAQKLLRCNPQTIPRKLNAQQSRRNHRHFREGLRRHLKSL